MTKHNFLRLSLEDTARISASTCLQQQSWALVNILRAQLFKGQPLFDVSVLQNSARSSYASECLVTKGDSKIPVCTRAIAAAVTNLSVLMEAEGGTMECLLQFVGVQIPEGRNGVWGQSPHESAGGWLGAKAVCCFLAWLSALKPPEDAELLAFWFLPEMQCKKRNGLWQGG